MVADINQANLKLVADKHKVEIIDPSAIFETAMDIYAPCAMGATLNQNSISQLQCSIVAGAANNQLADESVDGIRLLI